MYGLCMVCYGGVRYTLIGCFNQTLSWVGWVYSVPANELDTSDDIFMMTASSDSDWDARKYPMSRPYWGKRGVDFENFVRDFGAALAGKGDDDASLEETMFGLVPGSTMLDVDSQRLYSSVRLAPRPHKLRLPSHRQHPWTSYTPITVQRCACACMVRDSHGVPARGADIQHDHGQHRTPLEKTTWPQHESCPVPRAIASDPPTTCMLVCGAAAITRRSCCYAAVAPSPAAERRAAAPGPSIAPPSTRCSRWWQDLCAAARSPPAHALFGAEHSLRARS